MARIANQIQAEIERFLNKLFNNLAEDQKIEIGKINNELENLLERDEIENLLAGIQTNEYLSRADLIDGVLDLTNTANRVNSSLIELEEDGEALFRKMRKQLDYFNSLNEKINPPYETILAIMKAIEDFDVKIGGQVITQSIRDVRDLEGLVMKIYQNVDMIPFRVPNRDLIKDYLKKLEDKEKGFEKIVAHKKVEIDLVFRKALDVIANDVVHFNVRVNEIFDQLLEATKPLTSASISIDVYIPDFEDDRDYAHFLTAKEEKNRETLLTLAVSNPHFSNVNFYDMTTEELIEYLENNYYN